MNHEKYLKGLGIEVNFFAKMNNSTGLTKKLTFYALNIVFYELLYLLFPPRLCANIRIGEMSKQNIFEGRRQILLFLCGP